MKARKHRMWTGAEIVRLKRFWPVMHREGLILEFDRSWESIRGMASSLKLKRPKNLGGHRNWKKIARDHVPVFNLPTDVPIQFKRPWS